MSKKLRVLAVGLMPSNLPGGVWGLGRFWAIWGEKSPEFFFPNVFGDTLRGVFMMFPDGFDAFWALQSPFWVLYHPL